jgi:pSer/pThr/pTyr-binding forkhead associated (FHA) protein
MKNGHSHYLKEILDQLEIRLQVLVEGSASQELSKSHFKQALAHDLVHTMRMHLATLPDGRISAPCQYIIHINPAHGKTWIPEQYLLDELSEALKNAGSEAGIYFTSVPDIRLIADYDLPIDEFTIEILSPQQITGTTSSLKSTDLEQNTDREPANNVFPEALLIINSSQTIHLKQNVTNIGRNPDNHIVIDDLRVSRSHAQLRFVKGSHMLFDLGSKGGTFINGKKVTRCMLNSGDVISLAGVPLIYIIEVASILTQTDVMPVDPAANKQLNSKIDPHISEK